MSDTHLVDEDARADAASVGMLVAWWAAQQPDRAAVLSATGDRTWRQLNERANQLVRALRRRGVRAGDSVALISRNRAEWVEVWAACNRGGYRLTPINWHLTGDEAAYIVDDCEAVVLVADASHADTASRRVGSVATGPGPARIRRRHRRLRALRRRDRRRGRRPTSTTRRSGARCSTRRARRVDRRASPGRRRRRRRPPPWPAPASTTTAPARTSTCAPGRCTTQRRSPSRSPCRSARGAPCC